MRGGVPHPPDECRRRRECLPGVEDACRRLADAGWLLVVVTNQPDIAARHDDASKLSMRSTT